MNMKVDKEDFFRVTTVSYFRWNEFVRERKGSFSSVTVVFYRHDRGVIPQDRH